MICPIQASEVDDRDEWRALIISDKVRDWSADKCRARADSWWASAQDAWMLIEARYIAKHSEAAWEQVEWAETLDFIASEVVSHTGPDDDLITSWVEFHTNRELQA